MHEMGIAMQVAEIAVGAIPADQIGQQVSRVNVRIGKLSAVVPESLRFCFEIIVKDGPLSGCLLNIEEMPVTSRCLDCGHQWTVDRPVFLCESCNSGRIRIISGQELEVTSIELADPDSPDSTDP